MIAQTHIQLEREPRVSAVESASGKVTVTIADGLDGAVSIEVQQQYADTFGDKVVQAICEARRRGTIRFEFIGVQPARSGGGGEQ